MSYFINPVDEGQYLLLAFEGEVPIREAEKARQEVESMLSAKRWRCLLMDVTHVNSNPSTIDLHQFASKFVSALPLGAKIALVVHTAQTRDAMFVEYVARNRGACLTALVDVDQAKAWLRGVKCVAATAREESLQRRRNHDS
jgi:hypothetical protein